MACGMKILQNQSGSFDTICPTVEEMRVHLTGRNNPSQCYWLCCSLAWDVNIVED